jgi:sigma-B regulation protein RsbU (phosphoserine phosphatase)
VAAALLMALASSTFESQAPVLDQPSETLRTLHESLRARLQANHMNAALLIAVFSADARSAQVANAGMVAPLLVPGAEHGERRPCFIEVGGLPLGTALADLYRDVMVPLGPGDTLLFLSDGIVEAHNSAGELFGFERLEGLVAGLPPAISVADLVQRILDAVLAFVGDAEQHDDITLIAVRPTEAPLALHEDTAPQAARAAEVGR